MTAIRALAEVLADSLEAAPTLCGTAVCGLSPLVQRTRIIYAGLVPTLTDDVILALTETTGATADNRPIYRTGYDDPGFILHIISDDLLTADTLAQELRATFDRTAHHVTDYGKINTLALSPPRRTFRTSRPRYDLQIPISAEYIRRDAWDTLVLGDITFTQTDSTASITSSQYFAGMGFETEDIDITET